MQVNSNGHLYFCTDVGSEKLLLRGVDIDDELVVYGAHGYYAASPEGAHFVFLKFPGLPGYNSFHQFARTLHRPDLIRAVLDWQAGYARSTPHASSARQRRRANCRRRQQSHCPCQIDSYFEHWP